MLERRRAAVSAKTAAEIPPAFGTALVDRPSELGQTQNTTWTSFSMGHSASWPTESFQISPNDIQPNQPPLSHHFIMVPAQECSPISHDLALESNQPFPPFRYSSSSLNAALSDCQPSPSVNVAEISPESPITTDPRSPAIPDHLSPLSHETPDLGSDNSGSSTPIDPSSYNRNADILQRNGDSSSFVIPTYSPTRNGSRELPLVSAQTPISLAALNLSPSSSPHNASLPIDLQRVRQSSSTSMSFTPSETVQQLRRRTSMLSKRPKLPGPSRLSSSLPVISE